MRRRAELVSLRVDDIQMSDEGKCSILLRKSKTDQSSSGHWIHLSHETTFALKVWLQTANIKDGFVLRGIHTGNRIYPELGAVQVSRIFKSLARDADLNDEVVKGISGHSMRVGAAQDLLVNGASLPQIHGQGRMV